MAARQPHRRQPRALIEHAGDDLPERQLALPIRAQGGDEAEFRANWARTHTAPTIDPVSAPATLDGGRQDAAQVPLVFQRAGSPPPPRACSG